MPDVELALRLIRGPDANQPVEPVAAVLRDDTLVGRSADNDLVLADATVSRVHARLARSDSGWRIENLSQGNGVFVERREVPPGHIADVPPGACSVQIGGLLFACETLEGTRPVTEALDPGLSQLRPLPPLARLRVSRDGDAATVHVNDRLVTIKPLASLVLHALAERPGDVVHEWDLLERIDRDAHLPQAVSEIRRAFRRLADAGVLSEDDVRAWIQSTAAGDTPKTVSGAALYRQLVVARRGHGYALLVPASALVVEEAG